jgi:hypothetical protein
LALLGGKRPAKLENQINEKDLFNIDPPEEYFEWNKKKKTEFERKKLLKLQEFYKNEINFL